MTDSDNRSIWLLHVSCICIARARSGSFVTRWSVASLVGARGASRYPLEK